MGAIMIDLEKIRERLLAATTGPWEASETANGWVDGGIWQAAEVEGWSERHVKVATLSQWGRDAEDCEQQFERDARFIAAAPTDIAALIEEVERLRDTLDIFAVTCPACGGKGGMRGLDHRLGYEVDADCGLCDGLGLVSKDEAANHE